MQHIFGSQQEKAPKNAAVGVTEDRESDVEPTPSVK